MRKPDPHYRRHRFNRTPILPTMPFIFAALGSMPSCGPAKSNDFVYTPLSEATATDSDPTLTRRVADEQSGQHPALVLVEFEIHRPPALSLRIVRFVAWPDGIFISQHYNATERSVAGFIGRTDSAVIAETVKLLIKQGFFDQPQRFLAQHRNASSVVVYAASDAKSWFTSWTKPIATDTAVLMRQGGDAGQFLSMTKWLETHIKQIARTSVVIGDVLPDSNSMFRGLPIWQVFDFVNLLQEWHFDQPVIPQDLM